MEPLVEIQAFFHVKNDRWQQKRVLFSPVAYQKLDRRADADAVIVVIGRSAMGKAIFKMTTMPSCTVWAVCKARPG